MGSQIICEGICDQLDSQETSFVPNEEYIMSCPGCGDHIRQKDLVRHIDQRHMARVVSQSETPVVCLLCGRQNRTVEEHVKHLQKMHPNVVIHSEYHQVKGKSQSYTQKQAKTVRLSAQWDYQVVTKLNPKTAVSMVLQQLFQIHQQEKLYPFEQYQPWMPLCHLIWQTILTSPKHIPYYYISKQRLENGWHFRAFLFVSGSSPCA